MGIISPAREGRLPEARAPIKSTTSATQLEQERSEESEGKNVDEEKKTDLKKPLIKKTQNVTVKRAVKGLPKASVSGAAAKVRKQTVMKPPPIPKLPKATKSVGLQKPVSSVRSPNVLKTAATSKLPAKLTKTNRAASKRKKSDVSQAKTPQSKPLNSTSHSKEVAKKSKLSVFLSQAKLKKAREAKKVKKEKPVVQKPKTQTTLIVETEKEETIVAVGGDEEQIMEDESGKDKAAGDQDVVSKPKPKVAIRKPKPTKEMKLQREEKKTVGNLDMETTDVAEKSASLSPSSPQLVINEDQEFFCAQEKTSRLAKYTDSIDSVIESSMVPKSDTKKEVQFDEDEQDLTEISPKQQTLKSKVKKPKQGDDQSIDDSIEEVVRGTVQNLSASPSSERNDESPPETPTKKGKKKVIANKEPTVSPETPSKKTKKAEKAEENSVKQQIKQKIFKVRKPKGKSPLRAREHSTSSPPSSPVGVKVELKSASSEEETTFSFPSPRSKSQPCVFSPLHFSSVHNVSPGFAPHPYGMYPPIHPPMGGMGPHAFGQLPVMSPLRIMHPDLPSGMVSPYPTPPPAHQRVSPAHSPPPFSSRFDEQGSPLDLKKVKDEENEAMETEPEEQSWLELNVKVKL